jgi:hypothetical protein
MRPNRSLSGLAIALLLVFTPALFATDLQVEGPQDTLLGPPERPDVNHCTLRKAIGNANADSAPYPQCAAGSGADSISFLTYFNTITFQLPGAGEDGNITGDMDITQSLTIVGPDTGMTIDAASLDRVFHINPSGAAGVVVTLQNLNIVHGSVSGNGGAILVNHATLNLINCTISGSQAANGAAIYATNGATVNIVNSTISGNTATTSAGAVLADGSSTVNVKNSTITANSGGAVKNAGGTINVRNSIVAGNSGTGAPNVDGTITSQGYNVVGPLGTGSMAAATADQLGVSDASVNLGPLQNNGGTTPTHALLAGSIAIDKGHSSGETTDQRGSTRPCDDATIANATGGDGADVGAFEVQTACSNTPPDAVDDSATIMEDSGANAISVLANDTDSNGDTLTITAVTQGAHGTVTFSAASVGYTPNPNFFGTDSFTYTIDDGHSATDTATVSVTVLNVEDPPNAADDNAAILEDSGANAIDVLANDSDVDGDALAITAVTQGAHGAVVFSAASVSYTPAHDFFGSDSFTYTISDGNGGTATATVHVTVQNVNDPPVGNADTYAMDEDTTLTVAGPGVLANDTDVDGDALHAVLFSPASHGSVAGNADGSFTYTPAPSFTGTDSFTYRPNDGTVDGNAATVTITVRDTQPPALSASVTTSTLWPPDHTLVNVGLSFSATDNSGSATTSLAVFSDEDDVTAAGGDQSPDAKDVAPGTLRLRAERNAAGNGRVYLVIVTATDPSLNTSRSCLTVTVPKSSSSADTHAVSTEAAAAAAQCQATGLAPAGYFMVGDGPTIGPKQ